MVTSKQCYVYEKAMCDARLDAGLFINLFLFRITTPGKPYYYYLTGTAISVRFMNFMSPDYFEFVSTRMNNLPLNCMSAMSYNVAIIKIALCCLSAIRTMLYCKDVNCRLLNQKVTLMPSLLINLSFCYT